MLLELAAKVNYQIDANNPYPSAFTGHVRIIYKDGTDIEVKQGYMRGGVDAPLTSEEITEKFYANCRYGGHNDPDKLLAICERIGSMRDGYQLISKLGESK
jgi:hypothetical protein